MTQAHKSHAIIGREGDLRISGLPFREGERVEVVILRAEPEPGTNPADALRGSILKDERPFDPVVPVEDWEAAR